MECFVVKIASEALADIKEIADWYNTQQSGLGERFKKSAIQQIDSLKKYPLIYAIRYAQIRCMVVKKFPYMVHYYVNNSKKTVEVLAVISTSRDPEIWKKRTKCN